jgi:thiamine pyrophosphokinase
VGLVLNGAPPTPAELALLDACGAVVCADGGAASVLASGRVPTLIVGDLDSLRDEARRAAEQRGARIEAHPARKDETDGELALAAALALGPSELLLLGAHGGATAMFLGNLHLLRRAAERCDAVMVGQREALRFVLAGQEARFAARAGARLDVLPWEGDVVVTLEGTAWDAARLRIRRGRARGVSNRIVRGAARLVVHRGSALAIHGQ